MPWHYRIRKRMINGQPWYDVVEFIRMGKSRGWTQNSMEPSGETRAQVIRTLEMMLKDCKSTKAFTDTDAIKAARVKK